MLDELVIQSIDVPGGELRVLQPAEAEPGGAPEAKDVQPDPGPVAPTEDES